MNLGPISPRPDPDRILDEAIEWVERQQRFMQRAYGVLAGDLAECRRTLVFARCRDGVFTMRAYNLARDGWANDCPEPIPPPPPCPGMGTVQHGMR